ncbi:MAG: hypothetical protein QM639_04425 [Rhodocyclaceae bacterium]
MTCHAHACDALPLARLAVLVSRLCDLIDDGTISFDAAEGHLVEASELFDAIDKAAHDVSAPTRDHAALFQRLEAFALSCATEGHPERAAACHALGIPCSEPSNFPTPAGA